MPEAADCGEKYEAEVADETETWPGVDVDVVVWELVSVGVVGFVIVARRARGELGAP